MQLTYAGPKPMISHTGIVFDIKKKDKYSYLQSAVQLLKALDQEYFEEQSIVYTTEDRLYSDQELRQIIMDYCPSAEAEAEAWVQRRTKLIDAEYASAEKNGRLNTEERTALIGNLRLMRDYRLQRSINKSFYYSAIYVLASLVVRKHIRFVKAPFTQEYFHVFHTIEGVIQRLRLPISATMEVYTERGILTLRLDIASR